MAINLLYFIGLAAMGFLCSLPIFFRASKTTFSEYAFKKDIWIYMWGLSLIGVSLLYYFLPDFHDTINPLKYKNILIPFGLSAFIYFAFLLETRWLLHLTIAVSSAIITFLIPNDIILFNFVPLIAERIIIFLSIYLITFFSQILNGMSAIFGIFVLTVLLGISLISIVGGLPISYGFICCMLAGIWMSFLCYNWYPSEIYLNDGACLSAGFLIACLFLYSSFEYATGSILILGAYLWAEILWVLIRKYILHLREPELYNNTSYFVCYMKDISAQAILVSVVKINLINIIFACFQIYAPNMFSLSLFTIIVNLWLMNILYHASDERLTLGQTNKAFMSEIKSGLKTIANSIKKGKE